MGTISKMITNEIISPCSVEKCKWTPLDNGYCKRHQRIFQFNELTSSGKNMCRFFFRGCDNEIEKDKKTCKECLEKKHTDKELCSHEECTNHVKGTKYCGKHLRDIYRDREIEEGIKFCDIARGCFNQCEKDYSSCKDCLEKQKEKDKKTFEKRKEMYSSLKEILSTDKSICVDCGNEFDKFLTSHKKESKRCLKCNESQKIQDAKRKDRKRNYKEENLKNLENYYGRYFKSAIKRDISFELNFEEFSKLITDKCYYCHHKIDTEVNGIDRLNNSLGYTLKNSVSCCEICNRMKHEYHPEYFVEKCRIITNKLIIPTEFIKKWFDYYSNKHNQCYKTYKKHAEEERKLEFKIEKADWDKLTRAPCYLCGFRQINGIGLDRVDNTIREYTLENCKPCCGTCNIMKNELSLDIFLKKCKDIADIWKDTSSLSLIPKFVQATRKDKKEKETAPRKKWTAKGFYYAIQSDTYKDILEINKEVLTIDELEKEVLVIQQYESFEDSQEYIKKFLNKLNMRRKRLT